MSAGAFSFYSIFFAVTSSVDRPPVQREIGAYLRFFDQRGRCGGSFANPPASKRVGVNRCGCLFCHRNTLLFYSEADYRFESSSEASVTTIKTGGFPCPLTLLTLLTLENTLLAGFVNVCGWQFVLSMFSVCVCSKRPPSRYCRPPWKNRRVGTVFRTLADEADGNLQKHTDTEKRDGG